MGVIAAFADCMGAFATGLSILLAASITILFLNESWFYC